jgi:ribosomal protein S18 acetylase RimI-like enzyme
MISDVRLATKNDAKELSRLNQEFNGGDRSHASEIIESLNKSTELIAVAVINDKVVGFACAQSFKSFCYQELQAEITEMYVEEASRRKGIASSLISFLEGNLQARGVKNIKVLTGRENNSAIKTYEICNYVKDDELVLHKRL